MLHLSFLSLLTLNSYDDRKASRIGFTHLGRGLWRIEKVETVASSENERGWRFSE
jgi:hypothetical protein